MMQAALFALLGPAVPALENRIAPFGEQEQDVSPLPLPYLVWQTISGIPENYLDDLPDMDKTRVQIDVWAATGAQAEAIAQSVRDALEPGAYMISFGNTTRDPETRAFRFGLDFDFLTPR